MKRPGRFLAALLLATAISHSAMAGAIVAPATSIIRLNDEPGWSALLEYRMASRALTDKDDTIISFDTQQLVVGAGVSPLEFLHVSAEVGRSKAERGTVEGEWGLVYTVGATLSVYEHALRATPTLPRKEALIVSVEGTYRWSESNFAEDNFNWHESLVIPKVTYVKDLAAQSVPHPRLPTGVTVALGLVYSLVTAEYDETDLDQNRDFGLMAEASARLSGDWVFRFRGLFYGRGDDEFAGGAAYYF